MNKLVSQKDNMKLKTMILCVCILFTWNLNVFAHPDGATPYWYTSAWIYGFTEGCAEKIEESQMFSAQLWPEQVRSVCGCTVDALRHSVTFEDVQQTPINPIVQAIVDVTLPVCVEEELARAKENPILGG